MIIARSLVLGLCLWLTHSLSASENRPNIVFIMADDLGWQDLGYMGSRYFETPNIDALAKQSLVFGRAYMYPTCSPSRAALLTGKQSFRTGCYTVPVLERGNSKDNIFSKWTVGLEHPLYSQPLNQAGYQLIHLGKWHIVGPHPKQENKFPLKKKLNQPKNGDLGWLASHRSPAIQKYYPTGRGFHENVGGSWWGDPARGYKKGYKAAGGGYVAPYHNPFVKEGPSGEWLTDRLTSDAIDFMKRHTDEPFFINLHYYSPHRPVVARNQKRLDHFINKAGDPVTGHGMKAKGKKDIAAYATMVESIDSNVQRIIDYLDQSGLRKNTVVIFTSDNGGNGHVSSTNQLRGAKGNIYEGGIRVPALINWPGKITPRRSEVPVCGMDYFPTFLKLAKIQNYSGVLDGENLVPLFDNDDGFEARPLFWHLASTYLNEPCSVIQQGKWKLIQFLKNGRTELYHLEKDQKESQNLRKSHPEVVADLTKKLTEWRQANKVPLPPSSVLEF